MVSVVSCKECTKCALHIKNVYPLCKRFVGASLKGLPYVSTFRVLSCSLRATRDVHLERHSEEARFDNASILGGMQC